MKQLIVRNVEDAVMKALKLQAARHGRSAEAEHRAILKEALLKQRDGSLKDHLLGIPSVGEDEDFLIPRTRARKVDL